MTDAPDIAVHGPDYVIAQDWASYGEDDHATWRTLYERQSRLLPGRVCDAFLDGLDALGLSAGQIPDFEQVNAALATATGWRIVAVPGLVPDDVFFTHLAARRFPVTRWIRRPEQLDYLQEPDIFHDLFGHAPLLANPVFGDYMAAYGRGGLKALRLNALSYLARVYWYTVEFGLIRTAAGLRIYGSGIVSSREESQYCLESSEPARIAFDLRRVMCTRYRIDDLQDIYFVIDSFDQLFDATRPDFTPIYRWAAQQPDIEPGAVIDGDVPVQRTA